MLQDFPIRGTTGLCNCFEVVVKTYSFLWISRALKGEGKGGLGCSRFLKGGAGKSVRNVKICCGGARTPPTPPARGAAPPPSTLRFFYAEHARSRRLSHSNFYYTTVTTTNTTTSIIIRCPNINCFGAREGMGPARLLLRPFSPLAGLDACSREHA